jgi:hypothetical protein
MQKLIPFIMIIFSLFLLNSCFKANDNIGHEGRCTGSSSCSACTSCSRCGHCGSGGTCGVCSGSSSGRSSSSGSSSRRSKPKKHKKSESYKSPKIYIDEININTNNRYIAGIATIKIYEKPSIKSKIIATVPKNTKLIQLSKDGFWHKVQVKKGGKPGYVYYKNEKRIE